MNRVFSKQSLVASVTAFSFVYGAFAPLASAQGSDQPAAAQAAPNEPAPNTEPAGPQGPSSEQIQAAKAAFTAGTEAHAAADFAKAESEFRKAHELIPSPHAEYWIADSMDKQNKPTRSVYEAYVLFLTNPAAAHVGEDKVNAAQERAAALKATLPATVLVETTPAGAQMTVDGKAHEGVTPLEIELNAGTHRLEFQLEGYDPAAVELDAEAGTKVRAPIELAKSAPVSSTAPVVETATDEPTPKSKVPAYVTLGVGAAGLITGTIFGILALSGKNDFDRNPTNEKADEVERNALISDMSFGIAITLGITGIVLLTAQDDPGTPTAKKAPNMVMAPFASPTGGGAVAQIKF